jgi:tripartite-type tricarboxylate transporter receptor subunit TctC
MACTGIGSFIHLAAELFKRSAGIDLKIVQFRGGGPALVDVLGGHSQVHLSTPMALLPQIRAGKLKALATAGLKRSIFLPDLPTISEAGVPGYKADNWFGIAVPVGTPQPIVDRLNQEIAACLRLPEMQKQLEGRGVEVDYLGPADFANFLAAETDKWARVVKEANIKPR